jgi:DNA-binding NarL/FixJ family response regulator
VTTEIEQQMLRGQSTEVGRPAPLRVAVFSTQELIRAGLTMLLAKDPARAVLVDQFAGAGHGHDVVVFDLVSAYGEARAPALRHLRRLVEAHHVVVAISRDAFGDVANRARTLGCADVVPVSTTAEDLLGILTSVVGPSGAADGRDTPRNGLTKRETEIVELVAGGLSNTEIAAELFLSVNSVKTYIRTAYKKMGVTTRSQAVLWAVRGGLGADAPSQRR